jgi:hypothetical protein
MRKNAQSSENTLVLAVMASATANNFGRLGGSTDTLKIIVEYRYIPMLGAVTI